MLNKVSFFTPHGAGLKCKIPYFINKEITSHDEVNENRKDYSLHEFLVILAWSFSEKFNKTQLLLFSTVMHDTCLQKQGSYGSRKSAD